MAADADLLALLDALPERARQPNLLFGVVRLLFGTLEPAAFRATVLEQREAVVRELLARRTQTNEPGRCAVLLPLLAGLPEPLALLEVGTSAGLNLLLDRYAYDYGAVRVGSGAVTFPCTLSGGVPVPARVPRVAWRAGIDLEPDVDPAWLEALVWPEMTDRLARLRAALAVRRADPPRVVRGDLVEELPALAAEAPADATLVVFHVAVLVYLDDDARARFEALVRELGAVWIAAEGGLDEVPEPRSHFVVSRDGEAIATCDPHGRWLRWLR